MSTNPQINMGLLREVLAKQKPELIGLLERLGSQPLTDERRESLRNAVAAELIATGLDEHDEPNAKGLLLEEIIDQLGHL